MYLEGRNSILESLRSGRDFKKILIQDGINKDEKVAEIMKLARKRRIQISYVPRQQLDKMSISASHQGFIAQVKEREDINLKDFVDQNIDKKELFFVYIREAQHQYNIGAIARTAECAGADGIIIPPNTNIMLEAVRGSAGAVEHINVFKDSLFNSIKICKDYNIRTVGIEVSGEKYYYEEDLTGPTMLIIGGEDRSLSMEIAKKCDIIVRIPMLGKVNSLNMSVASSIVMYEKVKQELEREV